MRLRWYINRQGPQLALLAALPLMIGALVLVRLQSACELAARRELRETLLVTPLTPREILIAYLYPPARSLTPIMLAPYCAAVAAFLWQFYDLLLSEWWREATAKTLLLCAIPLCATGVIIAIYIRICGYACVTWRMMRRSGVPLERDRVSSPLLIFVEWGVVAPALFVVAWPSVDPALLMAGTVRIFAHSIVEMAPRLFAEPRLDVFISCSVLGAFFAWRRLPLLAAIAFFAPSLMICATPPNPSWSGGVLPKVRWFGWTYFTYGLWPVAASSILLVIRAANRLVEVRSRAEALYQSDGDSP